MSGVRRRPQAEEDLFEIALYIARDNPIASDEFLDTMSEKFDLEARGGAGTHALARQRLRARRRCRWR